MLTVRKGNRTLSIPAGSLKKFKSAGWVYTDVENTSIGVDPEELTEETTDEEVENDSEEEDIIYVDPEELAKKPIKDLDSDELRILAEYKGIDVESITSTRGLRAALRALE